jgi:neutral amino acid transport system substrate-binding protein
MVHPSRQWGFGLLLLISSMAIAACQSTEPSLSPAEKPAITAEALRLGVLLPQTGDASPMGQGMIAAMPLLTDAVNACGGANHAPVVLVIKDSETDPFAGRYRAQELLELDQVQGIIGDFASSVSNAVLNITVREQVVMISPGSTSPLFTERAQRGETQGLWARTVPSDVNQAAVLAQFAKSQGYQRVATVVIDNDYGVGLEQAFIKAFEALGGTVINRDDPARYNPYAEDFAAIAQSVFGDRPDAVLAVVYDYSGSRLLRTAYENQLVGDTQILLTDAAMSASFPRHVGQKADGNFYLAGAIGTLPSANGEGYADFAQRWSQAYPDKPISAFAAQTWDAGALMILAAAAGGANRREAIAQHLWEVANPPGEPVSDVCEALSLLAQGQEIDYQGASGTVDLDPYGDVVGSYDIWQVSPEGTLTKIDQVTPEVLIPVNLDPDDEAPDDEAPRDETPKP